jgi:WD40 repeat protein
MRRLDLLSFVSGEGDDVTSGDNSPRSVDIIRIAPVSNTIIAHSRKDRSISVFSANGVHFCSRDAEEFLEWILIGSCLDSEVLITGGTKGVVVIRRIPDLSITRTIRHTQNQGTLRCAEFSPDGRFLMVGGDDGRLVVLDYLNEEADS